MIEVQVGPWADLASLAASPPRQTGEVNRGVSGRLFRAETIRICLFSALSFFYCLISLQLFYIILPRFLPLAEHMHKVSLSRNAAGSEIFKLNLDAGEFEMLDLDPHPHQLRTI